MTMAMGNNGMGMRKFAILMLLAIAVLAGIGLMQMTLVGGTSISHAVSKHGSDAFAAFNCLDKNGADIIYRKGTNEKRAVQLCLLPNGGGLAIRVIELINGKWEEITAYVNEDITTIDGAIVYAEEDMGTYGYFSWAKECWQLRYMLTFGPLIPEPEKNE